ncbi:hypothetical protein BK010_04070 [Tenericutes bacterium MO-XQ]|nr:hypothetical protein BK010_04070 [Tenericutes bacterium MO-XQ]
MKKYILIIVICLGLMTMMMTMVYGWFTYVQRKSISTFTSNDIETILYMNDDLATQTMMLENLAFIDFEDDLIQDKHKALNDVAEVVDFEMILSSSSPLSRSLITFDILDPSHPLIYLIITDETVVDYHEYLMSIIDPLETKTNILTQIETHNQMILTSLNEYIMLPGETKQIRFVIWGDYEALDEPKDIKTYQTMLSIQFKIVNAYGDIQ